MKLFWNICFNSFTMKYGIFQYNVLGDLNFNFVSQKAQKPRGFVPVKHNHCRVWSLEESWIYISWLINQIFFLYLMMLMRPMQTMYKLCWTQACQPSLDWPVSLCSLKFPFVSTFLCSANCFSSGHISSIPCA